LNPIISNPHFNAYPNDLPKTPMSNDSSLRY